MSPDFKRIALRTSKLGADGAQLQVLRGANFSFVSFDSRWIRVNGVEWYKHHAATDFARLNGRERLYLSMNRGITGYAWRDKRSRFGAHLRRTYPHRLGAPGEALRSLLVLPPPLSLIHISEPTRPY